MIASNFPIGIFLIPFFSALLVVVGGLLIRGSARVIALSALVAMNGCAYAAAIVVFDDMTLQTKLGGWMPPLGIELILDRFATFGVLLISTVALLVVVAARDVIDREMAGRQTYFYALLLLLLAGLSGLVLAGDLFNLFVHLEVASLSAAALVACGSRGAPRAGLRYLVMGSLGASLYLLGVGIIYAAVGSLNMADVAARISSGLASGEVSQRLVVFAAILITVGLSVKIALFPLHGWMPDAYALSPNASAALMAPLVTKISALALMRVLFFVFGPAFLRNVLLFSELLLWSGALAVVYGGVMAWRQSNLRRMFAYSSVAQIGIVIVGLGFFSVEGAIGAMLHVANDALMKTALFLVTAVLVLRHGITDVADLRGLRGKSPLLAVTVLIVGLSLIGVPPLAGFFAKWYVLSAALTAGRWEIAALLIFGSLATVAYVFRMIEQMYFSGATSSVAEVLAEQRFRRETVFAFLFALLVILIGLCNQQLVSRVVVPALSGVEL